MPSKIVARGNTSNGKKRKLFIPAGLHPDFSRLRHRTWKCMAFSLYHGKIRRCGLRGYLSDFARHSWPSHHGHGIFRGPCQPQISGKKLPCTGTEKHEMASAFLSCHGRQLSAHDVLHHGRRLDAGLYCKNAPGRIHRTDAG